MTRHIPYERRNRYRGWSGWKVHCLAGSRVVTDDLTLVWNWKSIATYILLAPTLSKTRPKMDDQLSDAPVSTTRDATVYVAATGLGWAILGLYFFATQRFETGAICTALAIVSYLLVHLVEVECVSMRLAVHLNLFILVGGICGECLSAGGFTADALCLLVCVAMLAICQLDLPIAGLWIASMFLLSIALNLGTQSFDELRITGAFDRTMYQLVAAAGIIGTFVYSVQRIRKERRSLREQQLIQQLRVVTLELGEQTRLLNLAEEVAQVGHWRWCIESDEVHLSAEARRILARPALHDLDELDSFVNLFSAHNGGILKRTLQAAACDTTHFELAEQISTPKGDRYVIFRGHSEQSSHGNISAVFGIIKDYTDSYRAQQELQAKAQELDTLARFDPLTGLANRLSFQKELVESVDRARFGNREMALLLIDLDGFKAINDTKGHPAGDRILKQVASRLLAVVREGDTVARLGGDEFTVILNSVKDELDVALVAGRIMRAISQPCYLDGQECFLGASVGAAIFPQHTSDVDELVSYADTAMYAAKQHGSGVEVYEPVMTSRVIRQQKLKEDLQVAWEQKQFHIVYQPQVAKDGSIIGVESLLRWDIDGRYISPNEFIPQLEESGAIVKVGEWVLRQSCIVAREWLNEGNPVRVSVNISPVQFKDPDFVDIVLDVAAETGVPGSLLDLELTESVFIHELQDAAIKLKMLKEHGITISIDDFGTGYSSLAYLQHLPIDRLKIDRAFVANIPNDDDGTIAASIIVLAHSLGLKVLAEGIETSKQFEFLAEHGCDEYQGFYFGRPMEAAGCTKLVHRWAKAPKVIPPLQNAETYISNVTNKSTS